MHRNNKLKRSLKHITIINKKRMNFNSSISHLNHSATIIELDKNIKLTNYEKTTFDFLLNIVKENNKINNKNPIILRVAGGWVRDKLLKRNSDDIDIVLNNCTGKEFTDLINNYEINKNHLKRHPIGIIKANPEQSKHLETATMELNGKWIDFVNLRAETYASHTRIPSMTFGTPFEDAQRRDFTINSLFYNLHNNEIEDYTGEGLKDLQNGIIRTPLDPKQTFLDDPIRVLRAIRFASRFNFKLVDEIKKAMNDPTIQEALMLKISRERVGKEIEGMFIGSKAEPTHALQLLHENHLHSYIFYVPEILKIISINSKNETFHVEKNKKWEKSYEITKLLYYHTNTTSTDNNNVVKDNYLLIRLLSAILLPFSDDFIIEKTNKRISIPFYIIKESLKLKNKDAEQVGNIILKYYKEYKDLINTDSFLLNKDNRSRVEAGVLLYKIKDLWEIVHQIAMIDDLLINYYKTNVYYNEKIEKKYLEVKQFYMNNNLIGCWNIKPILNGNDIIKLLKIQPGPKIKLYNENVLRWQLHYPNGSVQDATEYILNLNL